MIERKFIEEKVKELKIKTMLAEELSNFSFSHAELQKTPLGMKIIIFSGKPGLIVGRAGSNIKRLTEILKKDYKLESPQIEVREVDNLELDAQIMAERIGTQLMKFGVLRFKAIGHRNLQRIMQAGAVGAEIHINGRIPSSRSRSWRFYAGYLPKCGTVSDYDVNKGFKSVELKTGIAGITVHILKPGIRMPDKVFLKKEEVVEIGSSKE